MTQCISCDDTWLHYEYNVNVKFAMAAACSMICVNILIALFTVAVCFECNVNVKFAVAAV